MFEHTQVTGRPDDWIALPDGYRPGESYERTAIGAKDALKMFREVNKLIGKLPKHSADAPAKLIVRYSPALLADRDIKREVDQVKRTGEKVGVYCTDTYDAHKR